MRTIGIEYPARGEMHFCDLGEPPAPEGSQVLLETLYSGITNGTERHALMADHGYGSFPGRHGYQHVCRVAAVGPDAVAHAEGDVVFCGDYVGHRGWHIVQTAPLPPLMIALPPDLDHQACALLGVAGVALRAVRRLRVAAGQSVLSIGLGPIGIFGAQCARAVGARVTACDIVDSRLQAARDTGAHDAIDMRGDDAWERVKAHAPYDVIIEASGYDRAFFDIAEHRLIARGGAIGAIAVRGEATFPWGMLHTTEASIEVSCHFSVAELDCLLHFLRHGGVQVDPIISHRPSIDEAPAIYATMRDDPRALYGVVFDWH